MTEDKRTHIDFDGELELLDPDGRPASGPAVFSVPDFEVTDQISDRRIDVRRKHQDRRMEIRFEEKKDQRSGKDRRKGTWANMITI